MKAFCVQCSPEFSGMGGPGAQDLSPRAREAWRRRAERVVRLGRNAAWYSVGRNPAMFISCLDPVCMAATATCDSYVRRWNGQTIEEMWPNE
jgi:hypothetical protein